MVSDRVVDNLSFQISTATVIDTFRFPRLLQFLRLFDRVLLTFTYIYYCVYRLVFISITEDGYRKRKSTSLVPTVLMKFFILAAFVYGTVNMCPAN